MCRNGLDSNVTRPGSIIENALESMLRALAAKLADYRRRQRAVDSEMFDRKSVNNLLNLDQSVPRRDNHRLDAVPGSDLLHRLMDAPFDGPVGNF
jgi:hypothetical protein